MERSNGINSSSGFTLLEVLIALTIMVIAFAAIFESQSESIDASSRARQMNVVAMLARNEMIDTEYAIQGKAFEEVKEEDGAPFKAPFDGYRWTRKIKQIEFPEMNLASSGDGTSTEAGGNTSQEGDTEALETMTRLVSQFFSNALREVTVTIYWKKGAKEQSFALTTYWVDLNHEFQLQ